MNILRTTLLFILSVAMFLTACGQNYDTIDIMAISSVKEVIRDIIKIYSKEHPKTNFKITYKSTGGVYNEINGDQSNSNIVIMLNSEWLDNLINSNKVSSVEKFGKNTLVLVGSVYAKDSITAPSDIVALLANDRLGTGDPASNVFGKSTVDLLKYYNIYNNIEGKLRFFSNAKNTLQAVEVSQVNYGVIFQTDAMLSDAVKTVYTFSQESYKPIIYSVGLVSYNYTSASKDFINFMQTEDAQEILKSYGFL